MLAHYGEHRIDGDRKKIQATEIETFGKLLPYLKAAGE
jgi:hypothetical protein